MNEAAMTILWSVLLLGVLAIIFGLGLAIADKYLHVEADTRIEDIQAMLPNANCGACGYPGCAGYAEAIVNGDADNLSSCKPGLKSGCPDKIRKYLDEHPNADGSINPIKVK